MASMGDGTPRFAPPPFVAGYTLDVYCDRIHKGDDADRDSFAGRDFRDCRQQAVKAGWKINVKTRTATCPRHSKPK